MLEHVSSISGSGNAITCSCAVMHTRISAHNSVIYLQPSRTCVVGTSRRVSNSAWCAVNIQVTDAHEQRWADGSVALALADINRTGTLVYAAE